MVGLFSGITIADNHECAHKEASIGLFLVMRAAVMENANIPVFLILHDSLELCAVSMYLGQCQRTKVFVVALVNQDLYTYLGQVLAYTSSMLKKKESEMFLGGNLLQYQKSLSKIVRVMD